MMTLISLITLCACSPKTRGEELALDIRTMMLEADSLDLTTQVTADYGERVFEFTFRYTGGAQDGTLEITQPEAIAGLKATVSVSGGTLEFDGAMLDTGAVTSDGLSPAQCIPVLISQWQSGYISGCNFEKLNDFETLAVTTDITQTVTQRTWFDKKTHLPIKSELYDGGMMVIDCLFENIVIE
jgi:hypothetical protein